MGFNDKIAILFFSAFTLAACERIALMPRPEIDREGRPIERDSRGERIDRDRTDRTAARDEIVGTVERVDRNNNEIQLRTSDAKVVVIKYDSATVVYNRDQDVGIEALRSRDQVLVKVSRNSRGEQYADTIRLNDARTLGSRND
jgi:hypothetical protein